MNIIEDFEFLSWIERAMMFKINMYEDMLELGISEENAYMFSSSEATKQRSIVQLYQDYAMDHKIPGVPFDKTYQEDFKKYIEYCYLKYLNIK